ncbi:hypothetical protein [Streptomyces sp. 184]|uniref:ApeA N-terminal domain 1-containing protein n=1 Tax=Streptomyces sp. 184 TaxID=1827526 RepID=UPI0038925F65
MTNDPLNLDEAGEWADRWWLPDAPDEQVPGVLRYAPEGGLSLSLIGAFADRITSNPALGVTAYHEGTRMWDVIHGAAEQREITLIGCVPKGGKRTLFARVKSPDKQIVAAMTAIIGAHVSGEEDAAFSAAEVSVEDLGLWASSFVFRGFLGAPDGKIDGTGSISVEPVEAQSVVVDETEFRLEHRHTLPFFDERKGGTVGRTRDATFVRAVSAAPFSVRAAWATASLVQDLIALATNRAAGVIWLRLQVTGTNGRLAPRHHADVLYSPAALGQHDDKAADPNRVLHLCVAPVRGGRAPLVRGARPAEGGDQHDPGPALRAGQLRREQTPDGGGRCRGAAPRPAHR